MIRAFIIYFFKGGNKYAIVLEVQGKRTSLPASSKQFYELRGQFSKLQHERRTVEDIECIISTIYE